MSSAKADVKEEVEAARAEGAAAASGDAPAAAAASTAAAAPPEKKKEPTLIRGSLLLPTMSAQVMGTPGVREEGGGGDGGNGGGSGSGGGEGGPLSEPVGPVITME